MIEKKAKIIATLGPAIYSEKNLKLRIKTNISGCPSNNDCKNWHASQ